MTTKPTWQSSIKINAAVGFAVAFFMAYSDNIRDMILVLGGTMLYVLCDIAEKLKK